MFAENGVIGSNGGEEDITAEAVLVEVHLITARGTDGEFSPSDASCRQPGLLKQPLRTAVGLLGTDPPLPELLGVDGSYQ